MIDLYKLKDLCIKYNIKQICIPKSDWISADDNGWFEGIRFKDTTTCVYHDGSGLLTPEGHLSLVDSFSEFSYRAKFIFTCKEQHFEKYLKLKALW